MSKDVLEKLKHRAQSYLWRAAGMLGILFLEYVTANIGLLDLPPLIVTLIGLFAGEVTKFINVNIPQLKKARAEANNQPNQ